MNKTLKSSLLFLSIVLVFIAVFIFPSIALPISDQLLKMMKPDEMKFFFPLLLLLAFYISFSYWLLIQHTNQNKTFLFLKLSLANFILYPLMGFSELLFWSNAFKGIETIEFIKIFYRFVLTFVLFSSYLAIISKRTTSSADQRKTSKSFKQIMIKILLLSVIYFMIYNLFGYFVAWQFEATRVFYSGSTEMKGFLSVMLQNLSDLKFLFFQIFRGMLFGIAGYIFYSFLNCSRNKSLLIMALIFGGFGFQIILPNPLFPEMVRISHFIETTSSMLVFGAIAAYIFSRKKIGIAGKKIQV